MEVQINLLPKKKSSVAPDRIYLLILLAILILGLAGISTTKIFALMETKELQEKVDSLQEERSELEADHSQVKNDNTRIIQEIGMVASSRIITTEVVNHLVQPLKNGTLINIKYEDNGTTTLVTRFNRLEDIASYQSELLKKDGIREVSINKVSKTLEDLRQLVEGTESEPTPSDKVYFVDLQVSYETDMFMGKGGD